MKDLEKIAKEVERIHLVSNMAGEEIVRAGETIENIMTEIHGIFGGKTFAHSFSSGEVSYKIYSDGKEFQVHAGLSSDRHTYALFSFVVRKKKKGSKYLAGTGRWVDNFCGGLHTNPIIPSTREYKFSAENQIKKDNLFPDSVLVDSKAFFKMLAVNYENFRGRTGLILETLLNFPERLAEQLESLKLKQLQALPLLQNEARGSGRLQKAAEKLEEKQALLVLYRKKSEIFKQYFQTLEKKEQEWLCHEIYSLESPNEEVDKWLSEKYPDLVTEVGRDRVISAYLSAPS